MVDVDRVSLKLPKDVNMNWQRRYRDLSTSQKLEPYEGSKKIKPSLRYMTLFQVLTEKVRKVNLRYKRLNSNEPTKEYCGATDITISRSVQRLALIVPMSEQEL